MKLLKEASRCEGIKTFIIGDFKDFINEVKYIAWRFTHKLIVKEFNCLHTMTLQNVITGIKCVTKKHYNYDW